jgi:hypothetical protein
MTDDDMATKLLALKVRLAFAREDYGARELLNEAAIRLGEPPCLINLRRAPILQKLLTQ